jgi:ADP-ribosylglycohydrolase
MMQIDPDRPTYRDRVIGCWLGKAVGGTLGMPYEGQDGPLDLTFYNPAPTEMLPNDDLDLQVVWACVLNKMSTPNIDRHVLGQAWLDHVGFLWDEYGIAIRNLKLGLKPPVTGSYDNYFINAMGAPIRSEIWACLAPGNPGLAAAYAKEDACVDHAEDGIWAEMFLAALEAAAFVETDQDRLLDSSLAIIPKECATRRAVEDTRRWFQRTGDWRSVRESIVAAYGSANFTYAPMNIAFTVLGWLAGGGDFGRTICIAVNCGKDTDCTGATVGALMGILNPNGIPDVWLAPIGRNLVLSPDIVGISPPETLDSFTDLVIALKGRLDGSYPNAHIFEQGVDHLRIPVRRTFVDTFPESDSAPYLANCEEVSLAGVFDGLSKDRFDKDTMLLRYQFEMEAEGATRVMFNTPQKWRVWIDGAVAFAADGSAMTPSLHRAPANQIALLDLSAGTHDLVVAIQKPKAAENAEWVVGVGDGKTAVWHPKAFLQRS